MDTDELTEMAYESIGLAGEASLCLRAELGSACSEFRNEDDYLREILAYVKGIERAPQDYMDEWNIEHDAGAFEQGLPILRKHIEKTLAVPLSERGAPAF